MKKIIALLTMVCMLMTCMSLGVSAADESAYIVSSSPADGAINVSVDTDLEIEFSGFVDAATFDRDKVIINGSHDMVEAFEYSDLNPTVMVIDLKTLEYGTRYVVELRNVTVDDSKVNDVIAFTTEIPQVPEPTVIQTIDTTGSVMFNDGCPWNPESTLVDGANKIYPSNWWLSKTSLTNYTSIDKIVINAKLVSEEAESKIGVLTQTPANFAGMGTMYMSIEAPAAVTGEYEDYTINVSHDGDQENDVQIWLFANCDMYVRSITTYQNPDASTVTFTNEPLLEVDCSTSQQFSSWNTGNAGNAAFDSTEMASVTNMMWATLNQTIPNIQSAGKIRIYAKTTSGNDEDKQVVLTDVDTTSCASGWSVVVAETPAVTISGGEYKWYEIPVTNVKTGYSDARMWITDGLFVKEVQVLSAGHIEGEYYFGGFDIIKNYGENDEEVMTKGGIEAGDYSAVLSGIYNLSGKTQTLYLANALYENGMLKKIALDTATVDNNEALDAPLVATLEGVSDYKEGMEIKAFLWNEKLEPIKESISIEDDKRVRVLVIGNSITYHAPADFTASYGVNWTGAWGMAATSEADDYAHRLIAAADEAGYKTEFKIGNTLGFENDPSTPVETYAEHKDFDPDVLVIALGANVGETYKDTFAPYYEELIKYIGAEKVIVVTTICGGFAWDGITAMAEENGWALADCKATYDANSGDGNYTWGYMAQPTFGQNAVGWHPGNGGMKIMADQIWSDALDAAISDVAATK